MVISSQHFLIFLLQEVQTESNLFCSKKGKYHKNCRHPKPCTNTSKRQFASLNTDHVTLGQHNFVCKSLQNQPDCSSYTEYCHQQVVNQWVWLITFIFRTPFGLEYEATACTKYNQHKFEDVHNQFMILVGDPEQILKNNN